VFTLGDNAYESGTAAEFADCYDPAWGRHRARTRPALGNHDTRADPGANAYYDYFGANAGPPGRGYYSYDLGDWHVIVLNSNCWDGECAAGSVQERWLRRDLKANAGTLCTVAYWHFPYYVSSPKRRALWMRPVWEALYDYNVDLVLSGHFHGYERFGPQDPAGNEDSGRGIRQFVVGTGGHFFYRFEEVAPNSLMRNNTSYGVLELTLKRDRFLWNFRSVRDRFRDRGAAYCH